MSSLQGSILKELRQNTVRLGILGLAVVSCSVYLHSTTNKGGNTKVERTTQSEQLSAKKRVGVDSKFLQQFRRLLPICIPGINSKELGLLICLTTALIARTWLDIWFSNLTGYVVKSIVTRNKVEFIKRLIIEFGLMMWPMSIVNNSLKLLINSLSLSFRSRLTEFSLSQYLSGLTFYQMITLDSRLANADQLLTQDIEKFSESLSHLYSDLAKPLVDIFLFAYKLGQALGSESPLIMISYFIGSGILLRTISPPFGKYTAYEQKLEGEFRFVHSRLITHSEEVAFYNGGEREKDIVNSAFQRILAHCRKVYQLRFANGILDSALVKYLATMTAYYLLARPVFDSRYATRFMGLEDNDPTKIMEDYSRNSTYLVNLSQAIGRLLLAGKDLTRFAGFTSRVSELFEVLEDIKKGRLERASNRVDEGRTKVDSIDIGNLPSKTSIGSDRVTFDNVPIRTPTGDVLVESLSVEIKSGMHCIIIGPNGCGKSSFFRILAGLWPAFRGSLVRPSDDEVIYLPQKPYLALGSLRDQVIYPFTKEQAVSRGYDDEKLTEILRQVHLHYLVSREGGWDSIRDWADVLSGGEKQRMGMARLFFHSPKFAILDECTSAVSVDVEGLMYSRAKECGITLLTVSHRPSLLRYHDYALALDGEGGWEFRRLFHSGDSTTQTVISSGNNDTQANNLENRHSHLEVALKRINAEIFEAEQLRLAQAQEINDSAKFFEDKR